MGNGRETNSIGALERPYEEPSIGGVDAQVPVEERLEKPFGLGFGGNLIHDCALP